MRTAIDARGNRVSLSQPPRRIISLVPSQTELLADLGLAEQVVGVTRFCVHPHTWKAAKQIVGGTKQVNMERIEALKPDLILANLEENKREMVEALDTIAPTYVTDVDTISAALDMIRTVGSLTDKENEAEELIAGIEEAFVALDAFRPIRTAYLIWQAPYMTVGHDTFIHDVIARGGFVNVFGDQARYPEITVEALIETEADVVLLSSEPFPFREKHLEAFRRMLPDASVYLVDGELFSWYGSRLRKTPGYLEMLRGMIDGERAEGLER